MGRKSRYAVRTFECFGLLMVVLGGLLVSLTIALGG